jgi:hypothetical protein
MLFYNPQPAEDAANPQVGNSPHSTCHPDRSPASKFMPNFAPMLIPKFTRMFKLTLQYPDQPELCIPCTEGGT